MITDTFEAAIAPGVVEADEWAMICRSPFPNTLVIGPPDIAGSIITSVLPSLQRPIRHCDHCVAAVIREVRNGTLVIWAVERLDPDEQDQLFDFIGDCGNVVQVLSVTSIDPFEQVQRGAFAEDLYYRLSTIRLNVTPT